MIIEGASAPPVAGESGDGAGPGGVKDEYERLAEWVGVYHPRRRRWIWLTGFLALAAGIFAVLGWLVLAGGVGIASPGRDFSPVYFLIYATLVASVLAPVLAFVWLVLLLLRAANEQWEQEERRRKVASVVARDANFEAFYQGWCRARGEKG